MFEFLRKIDNDFFFRLKVERLERFLEENLSLNDPEIDKENETVSYHFKLRNINLQNFLNFCVKCASKSFGFKKSTQEQVQKTD